MIQDAASTPAPPGKLVVVLLNYCLGPMTIGCLETLEPEVARIPGARVIVADNASPDHSLREIEAAIRARGWGDWVETLPLPENGGFAYGNNRAIERALADPEVDLIYCLNPDTRVHPGGIQRPCAYLRAHPQVGIAGARVTWPDGQLNSGPHAIPSPLGELARASRIGRLRVRYARTSDHAQDRPAISCDWVSGAAFCVRREVFETVGFMDEGYFLYFEEVDFCVRARAAGWEIHYLRDAQITHFEGQATGLQDAARRPPYWFASRRRFFSKVYGRHGLVAADACWLAGRALCGVTRFLRGVTGDPVEQRLTLDLVLGDAWAFARGRVGGVPRIRVAQL
ncbi:MAG: glycosyltransferase family 2 protein [Planctomycetota bacterium]